MVTIRITFYKRDLIMKFNKLTSAILLSILSAQSQVYAAEQISLPAMKVEGSNIGEVSSEESGEYGYKKSRSSTRLNLDTKETPQSISIISQQQLNDFGLISIEEALDLVPGVNVERVETDRTYYTARGFDITNFQIDGLNTPNGSVFGNIQGDIDTITYDRIEVLRGANGLLTGTGNPSATVNFIRKRPTDEFKGKVSGLAGTWDRYRATADFSNSLNESGSVRGRFIAAVEDKDSYLDRYGKHRDVFYGVVDFQLSENSLLTIGHTYQNDEADKPLWGALPVAYSDGTPTQFDVSDSNAAEWAFWDNKTHSSFIELKSDLANEWSSTVQLSRVATESESELFYSYGSLDSATGLGMFAYPSAYDNKVETYVADAYASGPFSLAGREHELVVGAQWSRGDVWQESGYGQGIGTALSYEQFLSGNYPRPSFDAAFNDADWKEHQRSIYASANFDISDSINIILGSRYLDYELTGQSYGTQQDRAAQKLIPYIGTVFSLNEQLNLYASYTEIFQPQEEIDISRKPLDPIEGKTYEVGVKYDFNNGKALASASIFKTVQDNLAEVAGLIPNSIDAYYEGQDGMTSRGIELDLQGEVIDGLKVSAGYAYVNIEDADHNKTKTETPEQTFKFASTYQFQSAPEWKVGATVKWRDRTYGALVKQESYTVVDAMASYQFSPKLKATLNVYNIFNEEHLASLYWAGLFGQAFYGSPRSAAVSLDYNF